MVVIEVIYAALIGLMVGSFLNVVIHRFPCAILENADASLSCLLWPASTAPCCGHALSWRENVPVISWLMLRGHCAHCGAQITPRYMIVELLTSSLFGGMAYTGYGAAIANKTYRPAGFTVALGSKDLSLVEAAAAEAGLHLPTVPALREVFNATLADPELEGADWASIAEISRNSKK